jgi:hypothetical protein
MLAAAVTAFDIADWRNRQMHSPVLLMIAAKTGMPLNPVFHFACSCHINAPFLTLDKQDKQVNEIIFC